MNHKKLLRRDIAILRQDIADIKQEMYRWPERRREMRDLLAYCRQRLRQAYQERRGYGAGE